LIVFGFLTSNSTVPVIGSPLEITGNVELVPLLRTFNVFEEFDDVIASVRGFDLGCNIELNTLQRRLILRIFWVVILIFWGRAFID